MAELFKPLGLAALIALASPAFAQDTTADTGAAAETPAEAPAADAPAAGDGLPELDLGEEVAPEAAGIETYVDEVFGDWQRECLRNPDGDDPCQITQLLRESPDAAPFGKLSIGRLPEGGQAMAGSMIIVPLGTLLTQQITIAVDSGAGKRYPFRYCEQLGCIAQIGFTPAEVAGFKAGAGATITVVPAAAPDQKVEIAVSLSGFTAAFDSLPVPAGN